MSGRPPDALELESGLESPVFAGGVDAVESLLVVGVITRGVVVTGVPVTFEVDSVVRMTTRS